MLLSLRLEATCEQIRVLQLKTNYSERNTSGKLVYIRGQNLIVLLSWVKSLEKEGL